MCTGLGKFILITINILFLLIAIAFIAAGIILAFVPSTVLESGYKEMKATAEKDGYSLPKDAKELKDMPMVFNVGIAFLVFGIFMFIVSGFGCFGACCSSCCRGLLIFFAVIMILLMITEIVVGTLFLVTDSPLHTKIRDEMKEKIKSTYNETGHDSFSMIMNFVNKYFECCGVDNGRDFGTKPHRSCEVENETKGCYTKLTNLINDNIAWAGLVLAGILVLQLVEVIFAYVVYSSENKIGPV